MLNEALSFTWFIAGIFTAALMLLTIYSLYSIDKKGLKNFIYGLLCIVLAIFATLFEYYVFAPLTKVEASIFLPMNAYGALFAIYFITKGVYIYDQKDTDVKIEKDPKYKVFLTFIFASVFATIFEVTTTLIANNSTIHDFSHALADVIYISTFVYCLIYLLRLREPYKGGLFYNVVSNYILSLLVFLLAAMSMLQILAPIELLKIDTMEDLDTWKLVLLNMFHIPLIIAIFFSYRTVNLFKKYLEKYM